MNIDTLNLNLLRTFAAIYETGTLTRAAEQVALTQPALSHALKQLRETFEDELFVRDGGVYKPTRKADALAGPILAALDTLRGALEIARRFDPATARQTIRLALSDYSSQLVAPPLTARIFKDAPGIRCIVSQLAYERVRDQLRMGDIDLALMWHQGDTDGLSAEGVLEDRIVCLVRDGHPCAGGSMTLDTYTAYGHVLAGLHGELSSTIDEKLAEAGMRREVRLVVPYFSAVPEIVATSDIIASLPLRLAKRAAKIHPLTLFELPFDYPPVRFALTWHPRRQRDVALRWLRATIADVCAAL